jgi:hypothetical protein
MAACAALEVAPAGPRQHAGGGADLSQGAYDQVFEEGVLGKPLLQKQPV